MNIKINNFVEYKGSMLEYDNSAINQNKIIFGEYSPELFYKLNKLLIKDLKEMLYPKHCLICLLEIQITIFQI